MDQKKLTETLKSLEGALEELSLSLSGFFRTSSTKATAHGYLKGLLSSVDRKNSWQLAEKAGMAHPYRFQHFLGRSLWDADKIRDFHQTWVQKSLGSSDGVLIVDETGFLKKGAHSAGVSRQYSGTAGRIENCQIGVFLCWARQNAHTLIDRELYLPQNWIEAEDRCRAAGVPEDRPFYTKIALAQQMLERVLLNGFKPSWVAADEVYGKSYEFRSFLEERQQAYVVAVPRNQSLCLGLNKFPAEDILVSLRPGDWKELSCGAGSKGERTYTWASVPLNSLDRLYQRRLLVRQHLKKGEISFFLVFGPVGTTLEEIVRAAGERWRIEECFQSAKGEVGLDQYEVRSFSAWYRHMTLALLAHSLLVVMQSKVFEAYQIQDLRGDLKKKRKIGFGEEGRGK